MENLENSTLGRYSEEQDNPSTISVKKEEALVKVVRDYAEGGGVDPKAEALAQISMKHQGQLEAFEERINKVDSGISKGERGLDSLNKEIRKLEEEAKVLLESNKRVETLVWTGYLVLLVTVIITVLAYLQYISADSAKYQSNMSDMNALVKTQNENIENLKKQNENLEAESRGFQKIISCLKGRKYFGMSICFE